MQEIHDFGGNLKLLRFFVSCLLALTGVFTTSTPSNATEISAIGGRVTWDESTFYEPIGCSSFSFNYVNGTGIRLLEFKIEIKSRYGDKLNSHSVVGMPAGVTGAWTAQICKSQLTDGLGPYTVTLQVEDYSGSVRTGQGQLLFKSRTAAATPSPSATPKPTPSATTGGAANLTLTNLKIKLTSKTAVLSWSKILDSEGYETNYEVRISGKNNSSYGPWRETGFAPNAQFSKLTPGATYKVQIRAKTDSGIGPTKPLTFKAR
jgi:hypothetical protein